MTPTTILAVNGVLYLVLLIYSILKKRGKLGILLTAVYTTIAVGSVYFTKDEPSRTQGILMWPFFYYFLIYIILIAPFNRNKRFHERIVVPNTNVMNTVCDVFIVVSILYIIALSDKLLIALRSGNWLFVYVQMRSEDAVFHESFYEQVLINVTTYLRIPIVFYSLYVFAYRIPYKRRYLALVFPLVNSVVWAIYTASRTEFVVIGFIYLGCYYLCSSKFAGSFKRKITVIGSIFAVIGSIFIIAISASRFGEGETSWLVDYFGDSFVVANHMIAFTDRIGNGSYFFKQIFSILNIHVAPFHCRIDDGTAFHSLIGMRYSDFGPIGTIIYAFIGLLWMNYLQKKKQILIGDVYLIMYYFIVLLIGVFYDSATAYSWLIVIVASFILNKISVRNVKVKSHSVLSSAVSTGR